jgi:hypothetical protein
MRGLLVIAGIAAATAAAGTAKLHERLPSARPGAVLPSAGGVVLGETKRSAISAKWGKPVLCRNYGPGRLVDDWRCFWEIGSAYPDSPTPPVAGALVDWVEVRFSPGTDVASALTFFTTDPSRTRLRGWRTPEGIRIGATLAAVRRVYPRLRRSDEFGFVRHVAPFYEFRGARYDLWFVLAKGHHDLEQAPVKAIVLELSA